MIRRLFLAIVISEEVKYNIKPIYNLLKSTEADLNIVSLENLHFTLKFLGDVDEEMIPEIIEKLGSIKQKPFNIQVQGVGVFPCPERINVVWVGAKSEELISLMKTIDYTLDYIKKNDFEEEIPHLTIARVNFTKNKEKLKEAILNHKDDTFGEIIVDRMILFESKLTTQGPVYSMVGEFSFKN